MKIATFNVNSIRSRIELIAQWIARAEPDVLCFQEIKVQDSGFPEPVFRELGYESAVYGQKSYNGVTICSRLPMDAIRRGFGDPDWDQQSRLLTAEIAGITVINAYCPHGGPRGSDKYDYKFGFYQKLTEYCRQLIDSGKVLCLVGDLNIARSDQDVWDPVLLQDAIGTQPEEREALAGLLGTGLCDVFRDRNPERNGFTWWDYVGGGIWKDQGMRIDYILVSPSLTDKVGSIEPDLWPRRRREPKPSDHTPVVAVINT
ncbi:MAG: exodeoxyribonuclease III [Solirubrobacterales bacterium]